MTSTTYAKPHLSLEHQLELLKGRGLLVTDDQEGARWLGIIGYYRLSGYTYAYREIVDGVRTDRFLESTSLDQVLALYDFDRRLKLLALDALERIEVAVRCQVGFTLGLRGSYAHLDRANLDGKFTEAAPAADPDTPPEPSRYDEWITKVHEAEARSKEDFVLHFRRKYDGRLPVWVATEVLDFGGLSVLYEGLKHSDRNTIAAHFGVTDANGGNGKAMANWMQVLNLVRNLSAHHSRLWNRNLFAKPAARHLRSIPPLAFLAQQPHEVLARPFAPFMLMTYLLAQFEPENDWANRLVELVTSGLPRTGRSPAEMGLPDGWKSMLSTGQVVD